MINFTGSSKKRIVNLGDRRSGPTGTNYLEQTRLQRLQREEHRQKERAVVVLQTAVRRFLELTYEATALRQTWKAAPAAPGWCVRFRFIVRWCLSRQDLAESAGDLAVFWSTLNENEITLHEATAVVATLAQFLRHSDRIAASAATRAAAVDQLVNCINKCLDVVSRSGGSLRIDNWDQVSQDLFQGSVAYISRNENSQIASKEVALILRINSIRPLTGFVHFLSIPGIFAFNHIDTSAFEFPESELESLSKNALINLIKNFLDLHGDSRYTYHDYQIIGSIFDHIDFSVHSEDSANDYSEETESGPNSIGVPEASVQSIQTLYSATFINNLMEYFLKNDHVQDSGLAVKIVSGLFMLHPRSQSKLSMWITITPGAFKWFYDELKNYRLFHIIQELYSKGMDYLTWEELQHAISGRSGDVSMEDSIAEIEYSNSSNFWKAIFAFEEIYSFWLIVSNDIESFQNDKLNLEEAFEFLQFLRALCLTLVFVPPEKERSVSPITSNLKNISIALLNQLHLKNSRLHFLPEEFWKPRQLNFHIDSLIQLTVEEELNSQHDEDDEDIDPESTVFASPFGHLSSNSSGPFSHKVGGPGKARQPSDFLAKLQILKSVPFFVPFKDRVKIFQSLIDLDRQNMQPVDPFSLVHKITGDIRREFLLEDAFNSFYEIGPGFKNQLQVVFYNEYGGREAGIDGGGITKEFLTSVAQEAFNPDHELGLFKETAEHEIYPNNEISLKLTRKIDPEFQQTKLKYLRFLGMVIGKCFYENVLIDISFASFFLNKWCNDKMKNSINDLRSLDSQLFQNLMKLEAMNEDELEALDLNFAVNETLNGKPYVFELSRNGEASQVNDKNKLNYIHQISNFKLNSSLYIQTKAFIEGLEQVISPNWLKMFDSHELQMLISGGENDVNIQDWKDNVEYGGFFDDDLTIRYFWEVIREMKPDERFKLIKFVTSVSRAPLLGFGSLVPKFGIRNSGKDTNRLPTASTCVNLLKLPDYQDKRLLREKLLYAINEDARFDLS